MSKFIVYRASAGSGKTFMLVRKYLEQVFQSPGDYRRILAVTFTNKAADEMKGRILAELDLLQKSPENSKHLGHLMDFLQQPADWVQLVAGRAKAQMLHDYTRVSVGTIDSFFQQVLRSFARETGLSGDFELQLDPGLVLDEFSKYVFRAAADDQQIMGWLVEWVNDRMENGKPWYRLEADLVRMGKELLKESILTAMVSDESAIPSAEGIARLRSFCGKTMKDFNQKRAAISSEAFALINASSLTVKDFSSGLSGPAGTLLKLESAKNGPGKRAQDSIDNLDKWVVKKSPNRILIAETLFPELNRLMIRAVKLFDEEFSLFYTARAINRNLFALGFSALLFDFLKSYFNDNNQLLMNLVQPIVYQIIGDNPSPFLYEKTGTWYSHFLIDEFQDTSDLQWKNFKPLIEDSLSSDGLSMIVGDVKQSLYRWRNSNWRLLHDTAVSDMKAFGTDLRPLDTNQRSRSAIIAFNNRVFERLPAIASSTLSDEESVQDSAAEPNADIIRQVFDLAHQDNGRNAGSEGRVEVRFYLKEDQTDEWKSDHEKELVATVEDLLLNKGYSQADITFLVRNNLDADRITKILSASGHHWTFVSSDVFRIAACPVIKMIINAIRYLADPKTVFYRDLFLWDVSVRLNPGVFPVPDQQLAERESFDSFIRESSRDDILMFTDNLIRRYALDSNEADLAYIFQFRDQVKGCMQHGIGHAGGFLDWWEARGIKQMLVSESLGDSMRIMTIHKAKGLSSPVIIIPFCNWEFNHSGTKAPWLWVSTEDTPFTHVRMIPVRYESMLQQSCFSRYYQNERIEALLDSLNILYVAFTRAEDVLIAFCPFGKNIRTVADALYKELEGELVDGKVFHGGDADFKNISTRKKSMHDISLTSPMISGTMRSKIMQRVENEYVSARFGKNVHHVLEGVATSNDLDHSLIRSVNAGYLSADEAEDVRESILKLLEMNLVKDWFSGIWDILNEAVILVPGAGEKRPDRVMMKEGKVVVVDYKTGLREARHELQVQAYMKILGTMGYPSVEGYLLYLEAGEVVQVKSPGGSVQPGLWDQAI